MKLKCGRFSFKDNFSIDASSIYAKDGDITASYNTIKELGSGSFSKVYLAEHKQTRSLRCIKKIPKSTMPIDQQLSLFNEIKILYEIDHPNIMKLFEYYQNEEAFFLISEYYEGGELLDYINKNTITEQFAVKIMRQLLQAVSYLHCKRIIHRDIKPENLIFDSKGADAVLKLIDFGTSLKMATNERLHTALGTIYYVAPEVLFGNYDEKCDVWSCGVIMYILLSGRTPFESNNEAELVKKIKVGNFYFPAKEWSGVSQDAKHLIKRLLTFNPEKRPSAQAALGDEWFSLSLK